MLSKFRVLQGFRGHELVEDILEDPGNADITANVDFALLKKSGCDQKGTCFYFVH